MGKAQLPAITTTLYDLISTLHTQVGVEDDQMITAIVTYPLRTGQIRCIETSSTDHDRTGHHQDWHLHAACVVSAVRSSSPRTPPGGIEKPGELGEVACIPFATQARLQACEANPEKHVPHYGGLCAYGVAVGAQFDGDPMLWKIGDGKLDLNLNPDMQKTWESDMPGHMTKADTNGSVIQDKAPAALGSAFGSALPRPALLGGVRRATGAFGTATARP